jgi:hypothetical protein
MRARRMRSAAERDEQALSMIPGPAHASPAHPVLALQRSAGNQAVAAMLGRVRRQPVDPSAENKPPGNLGPPLQEAPLPPMGGLTYKNGQWHWWGKNLPIPIVGNTGDIPLDPRKIPDILKGDKDKRKKADCTPYTTHPHPAGSEAFLGQCCDQTTESAEHCCPPSRISQKAGCCRPGTFATPEKCEEFSLPPGWTPQLPPGLVVPQPGPKTPAPPPAPLKLDLSAGVVDDFDINSSALNDRQASKVQAVKSSVRSQIQLCPSTWIEIVGYADKPGGDELNLKLGQDRADRLRMVLQVDLLNLPPSGSLSLAPGGMMWARSEGSTGATPGGPGGGGEYNARDRKVEVTTHSLCQPLSQTLTPPGSALPGAGFGSFGGLGNLGSMPF